jgi:hypothetical protein
VAWRSRGVATYFRRARRLSEEQSQPLDTLGGLKVQKELIARMTAKMNLQSATPVSVIAGRGCIRLSEPQLTEPQGRRAAKAVRLHKRLPLPRPFFVTAWTSSARVKD